MKLIQVFICAILFVSCQGGLSTSNLETLLDKNENQLKEVANQFLKHICLIHNTCCVVVYH